MANFYITKEQTEDDVATLSAEESVHISRVLRMKKGDRVVLCDGEGYFYDAELFEFSEKEVRAHILSKRKAETEPRFEITVFQGVPKNPKLETIVQKLTEIGAVRIVPMNTVRAVAKLDKKEKIKRLSKIAREAAKQSKRAVIPEVCDTMNFKDAVKEAAKADIAVIAYEEERETSLKKVLCAKEAKDIKKISILIGPEGGFEKDEVECAAENKITPITLGKRILRTETAPIVVCSAVLYELGEME